MTSRHSLARANSATSTKSSITVGIDDLSSSTPPTSTNDTSSILASEADKDSNEVPPSVRRTQRVHMGIGSYNENLLSRMTRGQGHTSNGTSSRAISGKTLVEGEEEQHTQSDIVAAGNSRLNLDWTVETMTGESLLSKSPVLNLANKPSSTRSDLFGRALKAAVTMKSVLGKRGRLLAETGRGKLQSFGKRASLRPRDQKTAIELEEPPAKRRKTAKDASELGTPPQDFPQRTLKPLRTKIWLEKGLYTGQERGFNGKLTEKKNQLKRGEAGQMDPESTVMPLPMFAGERLLEKGRPYKLPFNIFSPLPPGQPKPEEWKKTRGNVFVGDAADTWKKNKLLEHSTCICETESGCDENCFNRFMFYECDDNNCNIGNEHCQNRSFEDLRKRHKIGGKYRIGVEVIKTKDRGYGVRSNRSFDPGQIIVEYTGEIITQDECERRMRSIYKHNECFYLMVFDQNMIIDATRGSIARFVNHSCEPNCKMVKWTVAGKPRMALFAGEHGIMTGDELTYDYNFDPFSSKNIQECRCGAASCRGILGPKPKDSKDIKDALKPLVKEASKRKLQRKIEGALRSTMSKKRKLAVPTSVKSTLIKAKVASSKRLIKAKILRSSTSRSARLVKKVSTTSLSSVREGKLGLSNTTASTTYGSARTFLKKPARKATRVARRVGATSAIRGLRARKILQ